MDKIVCAKNKKEYIEKAVGEFFPLFIKSLVDNNVLEVLKSDLPDDKKQKIYCELSLICNDLMFGYKHQQYKSLVSGMNKVIDFNKYMFKILN